MLLLVAGGAAMDVKGQGDAARFRARQGRFNADVAKNEAEFTNKAGALQERRSRNRTEQMVGNQRAILGSRYVDTTSGTAARIIDDTVGFGEEDALIIRTNAQRAAHGFSTQSSSFLRTASFAEDAGRTQQASTILTAGARGFALSK